MNNYLETTLGKDLVEKINSAKILVVGSGGIGCELLKNLVLSGFVNIHIIDLDTIDVSNLNRQFLFRSHHVGKSKAMIAKEVALKFNPKANIVAHHGNIKSAEFGISYFQSFDLVMNALDNVDARKHVNRLCLATNIPLIESGTTGYLGQVSVIKKGETECYECIPKATQKVYPICTIRSTPEKPVHCIVWAKEFYKLLFGKMNESMLWEDPEGEEKSVFMHLVSYEDKDLLTSEKREEYAKNVFRGLFEYEIQKKLEIKLYKGAQKSPIPIKLELIYSEKLPKSSIKETNAQQDSENIAELPDHQLWSLKECAQRFINCIIHMHTSLETKKLLGSYVFDKDDAIAMEFVTAAANLRSHIFNIPMKSLYDCKGIAGNIIPAIATTNAIVAGIQVLEAFKIIRDAQKLSTNCKYTYCNRMWNARGVLIDPTILAKPDPNCFVCSQRILDLYIDTHENTLEEFITKIVKKQLGVNEPTISLNGSTIYEEGEDSEESLLRNATKLLKDLPAGGIHHHTTVAIEDFSQDFECSLLIHHADNDTFDEEKYPEKFSLDKGPLEIAQKENKSDSTEVKKRKQSDDIETEVQDGPKRSRIDLTRQENEEDDEICILE